MCPFKYNVARFNLRYRSRFESDFPKWKRKKIRIPFILGRFLFCETKTQFSPRSQKRTQTAITIYLSHSSGIN